MQIRHHLFIFRNMYCTSNLFVVKVGKMTEQNSVVILNLSRNKVVGAAEDHGVWHVAE